MSDHYLDELRRIGAGLRELQARVAGAIADLDRTSAEAKLARIREICEAVEERAAKNQTLLATEISGEQMREIFAIACGRTRESEILAAASDSKKGSRK